jgi:uncharacterized membrane protein
MVRWFDVTITAEPQVLFERLAPQCDGLEMHMLADLLNPDDIPEGRRWQGGAVRLASSFAVQPPEAWSENGSRALETPSADAVYEPVELLAGADWLITRWHDGCHYRGADLVEHGLPPISRDEVRAAVAKRWVRCGQGTAGDLGVFVMNELALTYAAAHRRFYADLEEWEMRLYTAEEGGLEISEQDERQLHDLWGARARLRDWLNPLNIPGLREDADKAWLPGANHDATIGVDRRVDKALAALADLGETLRSSFHLLHIKKAEAKRERNERLQRDIGFLATGFVVPTLVVGFYGANTWIPGEHRHWGFWGMIVVMVVATVLVMVVLQRVLRDVHGPRARDGLPAAQSSSSPSSSATRRSISSRVARTSSSGRPLGSSSSQSR